MTIFKATNIHYLTGFKDSDNLTIDYLFNYKNNLIEGIALSIYNKT